jgi:hemerythrin-like domain-containing protein
MAAAIARIKDEHLALASVLYGLRHATGRIRKREAPDFPLLFALLDYIIAFPDRLHHPKEDEHLFRALAGRCVEARPLIAELTAEHVGGDQLIGALKDALVRYARVGEDAFGPFAAAVEAYAAFEWQHMGKEEEVLFPLAQRHLLPDDWARIDAAFRANDNPLAGLQPKAHAEALFRRILDLVPPRAPAYPA